MAAIPTGEPIMVGTIFTAKVLAFTTLTTTIIQGITGAIIIRGIMAAAITAEGVTGEEVMAAVGATEAVVVMAAAIHREFIRRICPEGHKDFGFPKSRPCLEST
jgi:hypothetical protein